MGDLVSTAIEFFRRRYRKGRVAISHKSDFLTRPDKKDKVTHEVYLKEYEADMLRILAHTFHSRMAEIARMALEWYLYVLKARDQEQRRQYFNKNRSPKKKLVPALVAYALFRIEEHRFLMVDRLPEFGCLFIQESPGYHTRT